MYMEKMSPEGRLSLPRSYIHVYDHTIQTSSLKQLDQSKPNFMWSIDRKGGTNVYNGQGHLTKMATMAINSKKSSSSDPEEIWL